MNYSTVCCYSARSAAADHLAHLQEFIPRTRSGRVLETSNAATSRAACFYSLTGCPQHTNTHTHTPGRSKGEFTRSAPGEIAAAGESSATSAFWPNGFLVRRSGRPEYRTFHPRFPARKWGKVLMKKDVFPVSDFRSEFTCREVAILARQFVCVWFSNK